MSIEWGFNRSISSDFEVDLCMCGDIGSCRRAGTADQSIGKISLKGVQECVGNDILGVDYSNRTEGSLI
jgi:hypothetical protein